MAVYQYQALASPRSLERGMITADSPRSARQQLRSRGWQVQAIEECQEKRRRFVRPRDRRKLLSLLRELSTLLSVGMPLLDALQQIARQHRGHFRAVLLDLHDKVSSGISLSESARRHPDVFDDLCVSILQAGEDAGTLDRSLARLAQFKERSYQLGSKLTTTLLYPMIVLILSTSIAVFLMTYVVPSIIQPLEEMGKTLPLPTRIVRSVSGFLVTWGWLCAVCLVLLFVVAALALRNPAIRRQFDRLILATPLLGDLIRKTAIVKIAVVLSTLLSSGIVFLHALKMAIATTRNTILREALLRCEKAVASGSNIAEALQHTQAFPPVMVQVFAIGEESGQLPELLDKLAVDYDQEVATAAQRFTTLLEPLLIISLATLVLLIALATMLPIMEVGNALE